MDEKASWIQTFSLLDAIPEGLFVLRSDNIVIFWNASIEDWTKISREKILGANINVFFPHLAEPKYSKFFQQIFSGGPPAFFSSQFHKHLIPCPLSNGTKRIIQTIVTGIPDMKDQSNCHALFTLQDLTDQANRLQDYRVIYEKSLNEVKKRNEVEKKLRSLTSELNRSNKELEDFASIASHDLKEPLRKIISFGDRLKKGANSLGDTENEYINRMIGSASRMQDFIDSLLEYSSVSIKTESFGPTSLDQVLSEIISDLEPLILDTGGQVEFKDLPTLMSNKMQMRQLFQNLIGNALKFHKEDEKPFVKIYSRESKSGFHEIFVEDNGIGFDEKCFDRILKPFERLHGRNIYEGTGIGLAICKKIVDRHKGEIAVKSQPGKGTTFIITLPDKPS